MKLTLLQRDGDTLTAPEELTIHSVEQLKDDLVIAVGGSDELVTIAMDRVGLIDTAAVQLLLSARLTLAGSGRELKIDRPSEAFRSTVSRLGLEDALLGGAPNI